MPSRFGSQVSASSPQIHLACGPTTADVTGAD